MQFSKTLEKAMHIAKAIAKENMHGSYASAHLLKALLHKDVELEPVLVQADMDVYYLADWADVRIEALPKSTAPKDEIPAAGDIATVLDDADRICLQTGDDEIAPIHVLASISTPGIVFSFDQLKTFPAQRQQLIDLASVSPEGARLLNEVKNATQSAAAPGSGGGKQALQNTRSIKPLWLPRGNWIPLLAGSRKYG